MKRTLDRVFKQSDRAAQSAYRMADVLTTGEKENPYSREQLSALMRGWRHWGNPPILDQGHEGACTGFAAASFINAGPIKPVATLREPEARALYIRARQLDDEPGEAYEGSTVNAAALALREQGRIVSFHWGRELDTVTRAILLDGPVMLGLDWTVDMYEPSPNGVITATGRVVGGHALTAVGVNVRGEFKVSGKAYKGSITIANSWGTSWGLNGFARIPLDDFAKLIDGIESPGDACIAIERRI